MLWRLDGQFALEDVLPVPRKKPISYNELDPASLFSRRQKTFPNKKSKPTVQGRHFTSGHKVVGNRSTPYEEKYAKMTYGDHYRKKVMQAIERERRRCAELLEEHKSRTSAGKALKQTTPQRTAPRYNLNELRHHQRRCAALLFSARERGAHQLPLLVKWAPKRRDSYYLMSERLYNDRLMMKLRNDEQSPLVFDFSYLDGETDDLHDLQKLIQSTSSHLKTMKLDTKFNDYDYNFDEGQQRAGDDSTTEALGENGNQGADSELSKAKRRVTFSDHVTHSDTDASFARPRSKRSNQQFEDLDPIDIEINFRSDGPERNRTSRTGDENEGTSRSQELGGESVSGNRFSSFRSRDSSLGLLSTQRGSSRFHDDDDYSSDFTGRSTEDPGVESRRRKDRYDWTADFDESSSKKLHNNPRCQHSFSSKSKDYYKKLPKLLKTSELRDKLPKERIPNARELGHDVDHSCMDAHKRAYERALVLARYKTLPPTYSFLAGKTTRRSFSYFSGLSGTNNAADLKLGGEKPAAATETYMAGRPAEGRKAIFDDIDMNDFYVEEDELFYYINPEELKHVVASSVSTDDNSREEDGLTTRTSLTTSRTTASNSAFASETPSGTEN